MAKKQQEGEALTPDKLVDELEKKYGLSSTFSKDVEVVSTGSYKLNIATGIGGYVRGKIVELWGPESSGKSTIVLHGIAEHQKAFPDKFVALFDYENSFDKIYAEQIGVDVDKLKLYQPDSQEQGYDLLLGLVEKELVSLIVIDSHTAAIPKAVIAGEMGDATIASQARNNSKFLAKVKGLLEKTKTSMLAVSQIRSAIGSMGETNTSTGGNSWKFYADMRFKLWKSLDKEKELNKTTLDVVKNKCAKPFGQAVIDICWGFGIDNYGEIIDLASDLNIIKKAGSWYSYKEDKLGQGKDSVKQLFEDNPELFEEIKEQVLNKIKEKE